MSNKLNLLPRLAQPSLHCMHPRNPYAIKRPDFAKLARSQPTLAPYVTITASGGALIDFADARALRALTSALLAEDFKLDVPLREDRLCPTLANRLDYLLHLLDLVPHLPDRPLRVLDIGTGHVAIYLLLLHWLRPEARSVGTDIDSTSLEHARDIMKRNNLTESIIQIIPASADGRLLAPLSDGKFTFSLCNPPFFSSPDELLASRALKAAPMPTAPTAADNEQITRGGEVAFVGQMIDESVTLAENCIWFTSLLGIYASLEPLVAQLKAKRIDNYFVLAIRQSRTTRWILGWSHQLHRLPDHLTRPDSVRQGTSFARLLPPGNTFTIRPHPARTVHYLYDAVWSVLIDISLNDGNTAWGNKQDGEEISNIELAPMANTWSRAARRAAARGAGNAVVSTSAFDANPLFRARLVFEASDLLGAAALRLEWTWGPDRAVVDSFWKFLQTKTGLVSKRSRTFGDASEDGDGGAEAREHKR